MSKDPFKDFVNSKVAEAKQPSIDVNKEKKFWLDKLEELYSLVTTWLQPYQITVTTKEKVLYEEVFGSYPAPMATIHIGNDEITLDPIGTFLFGARGRVNIIGPRGTAILLVVPKESRKPNIRVEVIIPGQNRQERPADPPVSDWAWKLASAPPTIQFTDLTKESFQDALMGVVNG